MRQETPAKTTSESSPLTESRKRTLIISIKHGGLMSLSFIFAEKDITTASRIIQR